MSVNAALTVVFSAFIVLDYGREFADRLADAHTQMAEEAKTLLPAIDRLCHDAPESVQTYIDDVCRRMRETDSPGHHIAVGWDGTVLQAVAHHRSSPEILQAMKEAARSPQHRSRAGDDEILVAAHEQKGLTVYVSEYLTNIRRALLGDILRRIGGIVVMGVVAAAIANVVLLRSVVKPIDRLVATVRQIASGRLGVQAAVLNTAELAYLANAINTMSSSLADADRERRQQMAKARRIQQHLLPSDMEIPGLAVAHVYQPATELAGDYYDALALADGTWLVCVADVTGHGVPAAMEAGILKALLLHATEHHARPDEILRFVNDRYRAICLPDDFASLLVARWDPRSPSLEYASAGHEPGWFLSADGTLVELSSTGPLLGVTPESTWEVATLRVAAGARLLLLTDGATEALNLENRLFGRQRLAGLFKECRGLPLSDAIRRTEAALSRHRGENPPGDDLTLIGVEFFSNAIAHDPGANLRLADADASRSSHDGP